MAKYDFSGWATRNDLRCSDGRTIRHGAFKVNDGQTVPLVWNHQHNEPYNVLGHALLENRDEGVYTYCTFNDTESGKNAKLLVQHGDISGLSIYANQLKQNGGDVLHGVIREVSLVLAGANPGAFIDSILAHGEASDEEAVIYTGKDIDATEGELEHSDKENTEMAKETNTDNEKTVQDVIDSMSEEQQKVMWALVAEAMGGDEDEEAEDNNEEEEPVKHNVFDNDDNEMTGDALSHAEMETIISDAKRYGSMKESFLAHAAEYGIEDIEYLFPEAKNLNTPPEFIQREMGWVPKVMSGVHHTPFSRIKSMFADITEDEARAKGYIKGKLKKEEVFSLLKRTTTPTTIYKKQKLDRDDVIDITDFDVISWLKTEMRMMLDEEIARAILIGDGRLASSDDKINETNIRPIWKDADLYTIKAKITPDSGATAADNAKAFIDTVIRSRKEYKGSGSPKLFTTEDIITECLLLEDGIGHKLYKSVAELATTMRVSEIITVEVMEGQTRTDDASDTVELLGLVVNLNDYNVGADKGGAISMFDDFDIDYNQQKYLIETRCSGALTKPKAAIAIEIKK